MQKNKTIALAGNPNSGKTTMFNALTGARQRVGNYPGVTVEKREGQIMHGDLAINVVDIPGTYSLTAYSQEELVARNFLVEERPDVVVDILNAASLERNLYLCVQFMEMGIPVVLALNMMDEVRKQGKIIDSEKLSRVLKVPVVETVARNGEGKEELIKQAVDFAGKRNGAWIPLDISYGPDLDPVLMEMSDLIKKENFLTDLYPAKWIALKYLENDEQIISLGQKNGPLGQKLSELADKTDKHCQATLDTNPEAIIADYRYGYISSIARQGVVTVTRQEDRLAFSDNLDRVLTQRILGPVIMLSVLYAMFQITFALGEIPMGWLEIFFNWLGDVTASILPDGLIRSLVVSGIIGGVGGVLGFTPLILIMFMMIAFLEDSGYMARMAYMMDRVLRIFGLHGCSVMPFIVSGGIPGGCAVPGVMAARTLRSPNEKLATLLTAPFMVCGAKVPVFILLTAVFFKNTAAGALFWITIGGWVAALVVSKILRSTVIRGEATPFVMELPPYRMPTLKGLLIHTWERAWQYVKKAGTVILAISVLLWAAMTFPSLPEDKSAEFQAMRDVVKSQEPTVQTREQKAALDDKLAKINKLEAQDALRHSLAGKIGSAMEPVTQKAGFDWQTNIALLGGFSAKEVIISTLSTAYSLGETDAEDSKSLADYLGKDPKWNAATAVSLIVFVMLYSPCFVTVVAMARESSWGWAAFSVVFNTLFAYVMAVAVFQIGQLFL
ncbi:MAG: ferrous iron transport protein B [Desulfobacterales bacterium]|nr:ferrous iron transport protein B [Desulfobacterales bacterium]